MKWARIDSQSAVVVELFDSEPVLHPSLMAEIAEVPDETELGMVQQADGTYAFPPAPVAPPVPIHPVEVLAGLLISKGVITAQDWETAKNG